MQKYKLKNEKGITLVTLVVTVIILLILAGISIAGITGNNGITKRTADAKNSAEVKSEISLIEVASNSARGKNKYGNINKTSLQKELDTSAGTNKTEVTEELDGNDKIGYKITFLDSKRYYFVYNEGEDTEIIFIGTVGKSTNSGIIHAIPRKGKVTVNTSETIEILLRVFSDIDNNNIDLSYGWSDSSYKEPDLYEKVNVNGSGNDKTAEASYPTKTGKYYLYVKAKINNEEEISKIFGDYNVVSGDDYTGKYTVIYERGDNVLKIGARHDTTTGEIKLPAITAENGFEATGWYENDEYVGDAGETININKNLTLTAKAKDSKAPTVRIAREDYNTFSWEAKDIEKINGYKITKSETPPSATDSDWETTGTLTSGTHDIDTASTYYVYVKDEKGNIGKASIDAYLVKKIQGAGTTLTAKVDGNNGIDLSNEMSVLEGTQIYASATANAGYSAVVLKSGNKRLNENGDNITINSATTIESTASREDTDAPTVIVAKTAYNTFSWQATDDGEIAGYQIILNPTETPSANGSGWKTDTLTSGTEEITDAGTYYVYVKDSKGNIGSGSIQAYIVMKTQGENTTLTVRADSTSASTGTELNSNTAVLKDTQIWIKSTANNGYTSTLKIDGTVQNTTETTITVNSSKTIESSATANTYTISYDYAGGTGGTNKPTSGTYDTDVQISNPTKTGYTFAGWTSSSSDGLGTNAKIGTAANPSTAWTGTATKNTYFKNLTDTNNGTVKLTATWTANTYTVEYYQGNNSTTAGSTKFSTTSSHTYGTAKALTTYATLGGTAPSGWTFAGWSTSQTGTAVSTVNSVSLTDGASVTNLTNTANGTVKLYAIFKRNILFKSGANAGTTNATKEQRYNPYKTTGYLTSVTSPSALTAITGWTATGTGTGYRNNATAGAATIGFSASVTPAYNATALTYYGVYRKVINVYSGVSKGTNNSQTQYLNTNGNIVSSISLAVPTAIENWTAIGYRDDTTADDKETEVTTSAVSITPAYSTSAISYYAVYSRTLTIKYNGNSPTSGSTESTTKTVYLNTNSTTTSSQQVTLANNGFIKNGYAFSKWAKGSTSGTQYSAGASYTARLAYNASSFEVTMYAIWQDVYLRTSEASTDGTEAKFLYTTIERRKIKSITFADSIAGHTVDGTTCFDVSSISNLKQVLLWITNTDENGYVDIVIGQNGGVKANPNSYQLFSYVGYTPSTFTIDFTNFDTSSVTNMSYMFSYCGYTAMTSLDLGDNFDTSSVTTMYGMFYCCGKAMTSIDLGEKFDTSNVTDMHSMFVSCGRTAMTSLDLGDKFDTSKVTDMTYMFSYCGYSAMTSLDLGDKFDTSKVTDMGSMFQYCGYTAMTSLDLGNKFDTSKVTYMSHMFSHCGYTAMTSLDLGDKFDTSRVTNMGSMFNSCGHTAMTSLDLGDKFDTSSTTNMASMFQECGYTAMTGLDIGDNFNTSSVKNMSYMFASCGYNSMTSLNLGDKFDTSSVTNMSSMFIACGYKVMTSLDLGSKFDTSSVTNMQYMFNNCGHTAMTSLDLGDKFNTSSVTTMNGMFQDCGYSTMTSLDLGDKFDTSKVTDMSNMFGFCGYTAMTSLDLGDKFDTSSVTNMWAMFCNCGYTAMTNLDLGDKFNTSSVTNMKQMFENCGYTAMTSLDLGDKFDTSNVTDMYHMFYKCPNLITIYATDSFVTTNVTDGYDMFNLDFKLVGGMGTVYDNIHKDKEYAHLDLGTTNPGYFTDKRTYYVEFDANGGTGTMARQIMTYGESSNLTTNAFTKAGYTFAGWNDKADGSGTSYTNEQSVLNLENGWKKVKTLYAQWKVATTLRKSEQNINSTEETFLYTTIRRSAIKSITFANSIAGHTVDGTTCFDVSSIENSGQVLLWITDDSGGYYDIVIGQEGGVIANPDSSYLFCNVGWGTPLTIDFTNFYTSGVTNMSCMFESCGYQAMTSLDLGNEFDTSSVTNMLYMFYNCGSRAMTSLNLGDKFDTSNVTNMRYMFYNCGYTAMTSLDLGDKFDTSSVTDMIAMFQKCGYREMTSLDLGDKFDTSNVMHMWYMFYECGYRAMTSLDLGDKFDTSNVIDMHYMFNSCGYTALTSLDLGDKFDTSNVTNMNSMFESCGHGALTELDISAMTFPNTLTQHSYIFRNCGKSNCQVYVKSATEKTWVETKKNTDWSNSNIIVGHLN